MTETKTFKDNYTREDALNYLHTVRTTISQLDGHRLSALHNAIALPSTLLVGAATTLYYTKGNTEDKAAFLLNVSYAFAIVSAGIFIIFMLKYYLFNEFIGDAVEIAKRTERDIGIEEDYSLTKQFETHWLAGRQGRWIIYAILFILIVAILVIYNFRMSVWIAK